MPRFHSWIDYLKSESVCCFFNLYPVSNCIQMIVNFSLQPFSIWWDGNYFNGYNFYLDILQIQENWASRNFITNSHVYSLLIAQAKKTDWIQQLIDGGILANQNSANHPHGFLSNQKEVQILAFLHVICERIVFIYLFVFFSHSRYIKIKRFKRCQLKYKLLWQGNLKKLGAYINRLP